MAPAVEEGPLRQVDTQESESGKENNDDQKAPSPSNSVGGNDNDLAGYFDIPMQSLNDDDPEHIRNQEIIANSVATTELELALKAELDRMVQRNELLKKEFTKMSAFVAKRKQRYKRKRKDEGAPKKKLTGYNLFVRERFARLKKENEEALKNVDSGAELKRIAPASNIASSGHAWSLLSDEEKARYNEMAKPDEDRFEKEAANYVAPDGFGDGKRPKTGYNVFFTKYITELKEKGEARGIGGGGAERGSVARIVGQAWKAMGKEERDKYEREADDLNENVPIEIKGSQSKESHINGHSKEAPHHNMDPHQMEGHHMHGPPMDLHHNSHPMDPHHPPMDSHHHPPPHPPYPSQPHGPPMADHPPLNDAPAPGTDPNDGALQPPQHPEMPPPYPPPEYGHGPPPPVIHQPAGYEAYPYGGPPPPPPHPFDPYGYPPPPYPPGMLPPPGAEGMPPYGLPPGMPGPYGPPPPAPYHDGQ